MLKHFLIVLVFLTFLSGCSNTVQSNPPRTATEELLISTAAEHAAVKLALQIPPHAAVFVDNSNFEGTDSKYAIGAIRASLLQKGMRLVDDKKTADIIVETRSGALSIDRDSFLIGVPQFNVPVPFTSSPLTLPEIALYGTEDQKGVAKFAITGLDAKKGTLIASQDPQYGFAHNKKKTVLIFISWTDTDAVPDEDSLNEDQNQTHETVAVKVGHPTDNGVPPQAYPHR